MSSLLNITPWDKVLTLANLFFELENDLCGGGGANWLYFFTDFSSNLVFMSAHDPGAGVISEMSASEESIESR